jgi:hypothetical protein
MATQATIPALASLAISFSVILHSPARAEKGNDHSWQFSFSPYVWGSKLEGDVATLPPAEPARVDVSFSDILENLDIAVMAIGQIHRDRFGFWGDVFYSKLSADGETRDQFFSDADYDQTLAFVTGGGSFRIVNRDFLNVDLLAGARWTYLDNKFDLEAGSLPGRNRHENEDWLDTLLGISGRVEMGASWYASGWAMTGVTGDSDTMHDLFGGLGYEFGTARSLIAGYRYIKVDYENGDFLYDVELSGPMAGFTFRW